MRPHDLRRSLHRPGVEAAQDEQLVARYETRVIPALGTISVVPV